MIDPQELRIGVNVMRESFFQPIYTRGTILYDFITVERHDIYACGTSPKSFMPIVITGDILVSMGLHKDNYGIYVLTTDGQYNSKSVNDIVLKEMVVEGETSWDCHISDSHLIFGGTPFSVIKHVHELQNIYYDRHKKRLICKDPAKI